MFIQHLLGLICILSHMKAVRQKVHFKNVIFLSDKCFLLRASWILTSLPDFHLKITLESWAAKHPNTWWKFQHQSIRQELCSTHALCLFANMSWICVFFIVARTISDVSKCSDDCWLINIIVDPCLKLQEIWKFSYVFSLYLWLLSRTSLIDIS